MALKNAVVSLIRSAAIEIVMGRVPWTNHCRDWSLVGSEKCRRIFELFGTSVTQCGDVNTVSVDL